MDKKKLPITKSPIIGLHYHAYPLSAVLSYNYYWPWFYSHYIQVYGMKDFSPVWGSPWFNFASFDIWNEGIPYLTNNHILDRNAVLENKIDLVTLVRKYIDRRWYAYAEVDNFFIPFRGSYQKHHQAHDIFIFGYDSSDKTFETVGFNQDMQYSFNKLKFIDFQKAFCDNTLTMSEEDMGGNGFIRFFSVLEGRECRFDVKLVLDSINEYLNSVDSMEKYRMYRTPPEGRVYGMATYRYMKEFFRLISDRRLPFDIRPIHLFWEHKNCMLLRLGYMCEKGILDGCEQVNDGYQLIVDKATAARDYAIRYLLFQKAKDLENIIGILDNIEGMERQLLTGVLEKLRRKQN